jgi:hypothetical protein
MEPVFMILGESCAHAAHLAIRKGSSVQELEYGALRDVLLQAGQILGDVAPVKDIQTGE